MRNDKINKKTIPWQLGEGRDQVKGTDYNSVQNSNEYRKESGPVNEKEENIILREKD